MNVRLSGLTYVLLLLLASASASASPFPYHLPPLAAASVGCGYATIADGNDPSTIYWNPAGIALMNQMSAQMTLTSFDGGSPASWSVLVANSARGESSQFGLGIIRRRSRNGSGEFTSFEVSNPLAYRGLRSNVAWGFAPKFIGENYGEKWVYGMKLDLGLSFETERKSGMTFALASQNCLGSNLRAFSWDTYGGVMSGSEENRLRMYMQARLDKPFNLDYLSQNYRLGAKLKPAEPLGIEFRVGLIRDKGLVQYTGGFAYPMGKKSNMIEYALIWTTSAKDSFAHFVTYGYHIQGGTPSVPGRMSF